MTDLDIVIVASSAIAIAAIAMSLYAKRLRLSDQIIRRRLRKALGRDDIKPEEFGC
jgi:hypothetical protein